MYFMYLCVYVYYKSEGYIMTSIEPTLFDKIGYIGPVILFVFNILQLFHRKPYLYAYLLCFVANSGLNKILKNAIAEPRPSGRVHLAFMESVHGSEKYGMPSGHAQSIFFSIAFVFLTTDNIWFILSLFFGALTLYQRYKYRRHNVTQLFVGTFIGFALGCVVYYTTKYYLEHQLEDSGSIDL